MLRLIDGKWYDTDKARLVGSDCNGKRGDDYACERLYRKRGGAFFLERQMGEHEDSFAHTDELYPMDYDKAREWAQAHLPHDVYAGEFCPPGGNATKKTLQLRVTPRAKAIALREAARRGTSLSQYVESLILADGGEDEDT